MTALRNGQDITNILRAFMKSYKVVKNGAGGVSEIVEYATTVFPSGNMAQHITLTFSGFTRSAVRSEGTVVQKYISDYPDGRNSKPRKVRQWGGGNKFLSGYNITVGIQERYVFDASHMTRDKNGQWSLVGYRSLMAKFIASGQESSGSLGSSKMFKRTFFVTYNPAYDVGQLWTGQQLTTTRGSYANFGDNDFDGNMSPEKMAYISSIAYAAMSYIISQIALAFGRAGASPPTTEMKFYGDSGQWATVHNFNTVKRQFKKAFPNQRFSTQYNPSNIRTLNWTDSSKKNRATTLADLRGLAAAGAGAAAAATPIPQVKVEPTSEATMADVSGLQADQLSFVRATNGVPTYTDDPRWYSADGRALFEQLIGDRSQAQLIVAGASINGLTLDGMAQQMVQAQMTNQEAYELLTAFVVSLERETGAMRGQDRVRADADINKLYQTLGSLQNTLASSSSEEFDPTTL
jgi:hypothetical protein